MIPFTKFEGVFIGNIWVATDTTLPVLNPATEEVIGHGPVASVELVEQAIASSREAFDTGQWPRMSPAERAAIMQNLLNLLIENRPKIHQLLVAEVGCSQHIIDTVQIGACLEHFQRAIDDAAKDDTYFLPVEETPNPADPAGPNLIGSAMVVREPMGVVSGITAYNFPFLLNLSKIVPALLTGNTLLLKPSPFTPFSALLFGELSKQAGIPAGVLNIVPGDVEVGNLLTSHPDIDMVTFTGSEKVGALIMGQAAPTLKPVHLELGGKSAMIVRADADIQQAAIAAIGGLTVNCGQGCALMTRFLVHNSVRPAFVATCKAIADTWPIGNPADPAILMGPLIRESQRERVASLVGAGIDEGATLVRGGGPVAGQDKGFFYDITLFDDVDNKSTIAQEEFFGPVGAIIGFDSDEEAIQIANDSRFGLSGAVMTADAAKAFEIARQIRTGSVHINGGMGKMAYGPIGGYKHSGIGREYGPHWLKEFTQEKSIFYPVGR